MRCLPRDLAAQTGPHELPRARVLVLSTYHFASAGADVVQYSVSDPLSPTRQSEIARVLDRCEQWRPTKIAVEATRDRQPEFDSSYAAYRREAHALSRNERQQIGFRLAARLGLPGVRTIDHRGDFTFGPVMEYAGAHDPGYIEEFEAWRAHRRTVEDSLQQNATMLKILRFMNAPDELRSNHARYVLDAGVGAGDSYVGADLLAVWYDRNIRIFANIVAEAEDGDRMLVLIGAGHAPILRELLRSAPDLALVDPLDVL